MDLKLLKELENKVSWLSNYIIHNANHLRKKNDDLKVGGHQASCASVVSILVVLYFKILNKNDRIAVKPHASPVFHAIQYLLGNQTLNSLKNFRKLMEHKLIHLIQKIIVMLIFQQALLV